MRSVLKSSYNSYILRSVSSVSLACGLLGALSQPAAAQQRVPGNDPECPIVAGVATCSGDISGGILSEPGDPIFDILNVENPTGPIAPAGILGIGVSRTDRDIVINVQDGVIINTFDDPNIANPAQGIFAITDNGFGVTINTGANITVGGNGQAAAGIEGVVQNGAGNLIITNRGSIDVDTSAQFASGILAQQLNGTGDITVNNRGELTIFSGSTGERDAPAAGILATTSIGGGTINVTNNASITISTAPGNIDSDFNGVAAGIVTNAFGAPTNTIINNTGQLTATGFFTNGIVAVTQNNDVDTASTIAVNNIGDISINGAGSFGVLVQSAGTSVDMEVNNNGEIILNGDGGTATGIFSLNQAENAVSSINNSADITGANGTLRGIGISSDGGAFGGTYEFNVTNTGDITFDEEFALGITAFSTDDENTTANITNTGDINLANTKAPNAAGIRATLNFVDPVANGAQGESRVIIENSGDITIGTGRGILADADFAAVQNSGDISTTGDNSTAILARSPTGNLDDGRAAISMSRGTISTLGANSDGLATQSSFSDISVGQTNIATAGDGSNGIHLFGLNGLQSANIDIDGTVVSTMGNNANGILYGERPDESALTANISDTEISTTGDNSSAFKVTNIGDISITVNNFAASTFATSGAGSDAIFIGGNLDPNETFLDAQNTAVFNDITVTTQGPSSRGIYLDNLGADGDGVTVLNSGDTVVASATTIAFGRTTISTIGDNSAGLFVENAAFGSDNGIRLFSSQVMDVTTLGNNSDAFFIGGAAASNATFMDTVLVDQLTAETMGENSRGFVYDNVGTNSELTIAIEDANILTRGGSSHAIAINNLEADAAVEFLIGGMTNLTTNGDGSHGLLFGGLNSGSVFADDTFSSDGLTITTAGANSHGFAFGTFANANNGSIMLSNGLVTTSGMGSNGVDVDAFPSGLLTIDNVEIDAAGIAVRMGSGDLTLNNNTNVQGRSGTAIQSLGGGTNIITNNDGGVITGDVLLGGGNDVFNANAGSRLTGNLDTGSGSDVVNIVDDSISGDVLLGDGDDIINLSGNLTASFAEISLNTVDGGVGNDLVVAITAAGNDLTLDANGLLLDQFNIETFAQDGPGGLTIIGTNDIAGTYELRGGTLTFNADMQNVDLVTASDTVLNLAGPVASLEVGGTVSTIGDPTATAEVIGNATFLSGSIYETRFLPSGESDLIAVGGIVDIQGGMVDAMGAAGDFVAGDEFVILTGAGGVNGQFDGLTIASTAFLDITLEYRGNDVLITLAGDELEDVNFTSAATTFNQNSAAIALSDFGTDDGTDSRNIVSELSFVMTPDAAAALDATSGEVHASVLGSGLRQGRFLPNFMMARARSISTDQSASIVRIETSTEDGENALSSGLDFSIWATGNYSDGSLNSDSNAASVSHDGYGFALGFDWSDTSNGLVLGLAAGYQTGDADVAARSSSASYDNFNIGAYGRIGTGRQGFTAQAAVSYALGDTDTARQITFGNIARTATANYDLDTFAVNSEMRYGFGKSDASWSFGPVLSLDHVNVKRGAFAETGAQALNLNGTSDNDSMTAFGAGLFANLQGKNGRFDASLAYDYADGDFSTTRLAFEGALTSGFDVRSPFANGSGVKTQLSGEFNLGGRWNIGAGYNGRFASDDNMHSLLLSIIWR